MTDDDGHVLSAVPVHNWPSREELIATAGGGAQGTGGGGGGRGGDGVEDGRSGAKGSVTHREQVIKYVEEIKTWLQQQPHHELPLVSFSALTCPPQVVRKIEEAADKYVAARHPHSSSPFAPAAATSSASASASVSASSAAAASNPELPQIQILASRLLTPVKPGVRSVLLFGGGARMSALG